MGDWYTWIMIIILKYDIKYKKDKYNAHIWDT